MEKRAALTFLGLEYLEKDALSKDVLMAAGGVGAAAATVLGASLLSKSYGKDFVKKTKGMKPATSRMVVKLKRTAGLSDMPHHEIKDMNNAFYLPPGSLSPLDKLDLYDQKEKAHQRGKKSLRRTADKILEANSNPQGGIFYGRKLKNPYVIAHEIGHALAQDESALKRYVEHSPGVMNKLFGLGAVLGTAAGVYNPKWIPKIGLGLAGLGAAAVGAEVYSERQATKRGLDLMRKAKMGPSKRGREALDIAGKTYTWPGIGTKVLAPLAAAGVAKLISNWKS